jgi:hypothetical protein
MHSAEVTCTVIKPSGETIDLGKVETTVNARWVKEQLGKAHGISGGTLYLTDDRRGEGAAEIADDDTVHQMMQLTESVTQL